MKKINRLLAILLAFAVVITTFSSDLTTARVFATEEETVIDTEGTINTVEKEEIETPAVEEENPATPAAPAEEEITGKEDDTQDEVTDETVKNPAVEEEDKEDAEAEESEEVRVKEFKESKTIDGIEISLYAEPEVLPDDAILDITKVEDEEENQIQDLIDEELGEEVKVEKTFSYDINIVSSETGEKYRPEDGTVEVKFAQIQEAASDDVSLEVYHVKDDLSSAEPVSDVVEEGTEISFDAEHFSIYSVVIKSNYQNNRVAQFLIYTRGTKPDGKPSDEKIFDNSTYNTNYSFENKTKVYPYEIAQALGIYEKDGYKFVKAFDKNTLETVEYYYLTGYVNNVSLWYHSAEGNNHNIGVGGNSSGVYFCYEKVQSKNTIPLVVAIRRDGKIPDEPGIFNGNYEYIGQGEESGHVYDNLKDYIGVADYNDPSLIQRTVDFEGKSYQVYAVNGTSAVTPMLSEEFKKDADKAAKLNKDEFIEWYVIKYQSKDQKWHVDGVVRTNNKLSLDYNANFPADAENPTGIVPFGKQHEKKSGGKARATVQFDDSEDLDGKPFVSCDNYTFLGWSKDKSAKEPTYTKTGLKTIEFDKNTVLYAVWERNAWITIDFVDYDEETKLQTTLTKKAGYKYSPSDYTGETPKREGYTWKKWSDPVVDEDGNVKYIAQYDPNQYKIEFHANAPKGETATGTMADMTLKYDESKKLTKNAFKIGDYEFKGWAIDEKSTVVKYTDEQEVKNLAKENDAVKKLYAVWEKATSKTVHFYLLIDGRAIPGDSSGQPQADYYPYSQSEYYSWEGTATPLKFVKNKDSRGNVYDTTEDRASNKVNAEILSRPKDKINTYLNNTYSSSINEEDVVWYVYKLQSDGYHIDGYPTGSVTYVANYDGAPKDQSDKKIRLNKSTKTYSVKSYEAAFGSAREGYTFLGWSKEPEGAVVYPSNEKIALKEHLTLYAQWAKNVSYTVNFITQDDNGSFVDGDGKAYVYDYRTNSVQVKDGEEITVSAQKATTYSRNNDLQAETSNNVTTFSPRFKGKDGVGYSVKDEQSGWSTVVKNEDGEYVINVYFTRDDLNVGLTVSSADHEWYYDGSEHEDNGFTYDPMDGDYKVTSVTTSAKVKDVSDTAENNNVISAFTVQDQSSGATYSYKVVDGKVYTTSNKLVTSIAVTFGKLTIKPRTVTLTSSNIGPREFNGRKFTADEAFKAGDDKAKTITASPLVDQKKTETTEEKHEGFVAGEGIDDSKITFTGSRTIVGGEDEEENVFDDKDGDDTVFTALKSNTKPENYKITKKYGDILVKDRTDKYVVYVKLGADGTGGKTTLTYNGTEQEADLSVKVYAQKTLLEKAKEAGERVVSTLLNLGVLVVNAEEGDETPAVIEGTKLDPVNDEIDGMKVVIDNLYVSGGKGTDVGHYPVWLNTKHMTIMTNIDGEPYDISKQVKIEVVNDAPAVVEQAENTVRALSVSERDQDSLTRIGELEVIPATITFTADDKYKPYGASDPKFTASISGLAGKDVANKDKIAAFFEKYLSLIRDRGEDAGGHYTIHISLPGYEENVVVPIEEISTRAVAIQEIELGDRQPEVSTYDDDIESVFRNYLPAFVDGTLTIGTIGDDDDDDDDTTTTITDTPVAAAPAPAVLGAQRAPATGEAPAVLGARRAGTSDTSVLGSIITIIVAAAIAFSMVFIKRKKNEEK